MKVISKSIFYKLSFCSVILILFSFKTPTIRINIKTETSSPQLIYALEKMYELQTEGRILISNSKPDIVIETFIATKNLKPEAYKIVSRGKLVEVSGGDAVGLMYGLLEVKNQLKLGKRKIESKEETPKLSFRAIKFNLPWDSYRRSPALQLHQETCRDTVFWKSFLDMMVENRFNKLTLWNLHPFSFMVKTKKYPEGCSLSDKDLPEWQKFWTTLFRMAKNRGIETYLINWNIFVSREFAKAHNVCDYCIDGKYNVPVGDTSEIIKDFTRESVKQVIDTYPDLAGLGITLGEGMGGMTSEERNKWLLDSYIMGARMASRKIKFIYRVPLSAGTGSGGSTSIAVEKMTRTTLDTLTCFNGPINIELKFNWSHAFSTPHLVKVHGGKLTDVYWNPLPTNYALAWMMRNEDFYMLRWGQTEFLRRHVTMNAHSYVNGYYVGSETYIPAKDYITALPGTNNKYAFERQWMYYKTLGRIYYNPATSDQVFIDEFEQRFPKLGKILFQAQQKASKVPLVVASWFNGTWDMALYSEGMIQTISTDGKKSFKLMPLEGIADKIPMDPEYLSIDTFLNNETNLAKGKISPIQLTDSLAQLCNEAIDGIKNIKTDKDVNLLYEVSDIKAWAYLGLYFSNKLRAGVEYKRYKITNNKSDLDNSIQWLTKATQNWRSLVEVTTPVYNPVPLTHFCDNAPELKQELFHWSLFENQVIAELEWLKSLR